MMMKQALVGAKIVLKDKVEMDTSIVRVMNESGKPRVTGRIVSLPNRSGQVEIDGDFGRAFPTLDMIDLLEEAPPSVVNEAARLAETNEAARNEVIQLRAELAASNGGASMDAVTKRLDEVETQLSAARAQIAVLVNSDSEARERAKRASNLPPDERFITRADAMAMVSESIAAAIRPDVARVNAALSDAG